MQHNQTKLNQNEIKKTKYIKQIEDFFDEVEFQSGPDTEKENSFIETDFTN